MGVVAAVAILLAFAFPAQAQPTEASYRITGTSIGGARLGLARRDYTGIFAEKAFETRFAGGLTRLVFTKRKIQVYLSSPTGRGIGLMTSAREYRTAEGVGPCSPVGALTRAYAGRLHPYRAAKSGRIVAYGLGRLIFATTAHGTVGAVMLATRMPLSTALNAAPCGEVGEG